MKNKIKLPDSILKGFVTHCLPLAFTASPSKDFILNLLAL
jgi:hypothetical protein